LNADAIGLLDPHAPEQSAATDRPALEIEGLSYAYTRAGRALDGVSFAVPEGRFTALLGPNGAGKTTLMSLVTRLFVGTEGRIMVSGHDIRQDTRAALASMGVVFQRLTLDLDLTVAQNLRYAAALHGIPRRLARQRIAEAARRFGFEDRLKAMARTLSGGYRRRVEIARALMHGPRLLVLDEPTVGLDIDSRRDIVAHVHALCREERLAVLWATHLIDEIWPGDRIVILHRGRVRAAGTAEEVTEVAATADLAEAYLKLTARPAA
jgi:ABC-2 type transport system ATP-binding protein